MIKVKKLVWNGNFNNYNFYRIVYINFLSNSKPFYQVEENYFGVERSGTVNIEFKTLEEAQDYVQTLWNEYVLSLIEVENEC